MATTSLIPQYSLSFRSDESKILAEYINNSRSVEIIGMKRVGISHFLRNFLYNPIVKKEYFTNFNSQLFIPINLNNLIERDLLPFWRLTFKRIIDSIANLDNINPKLREKISDLFLYSIQTNDLLFTLDGVRESIIMLSQAGFIPTLYLIRFDRLKNVLTPAFFDNLKELIEITNNKLSFVITSRKSLPELSPKVFNKVDYSSFAKTMYIKPANKLDSSVIINSKIKNQHLNNDWLDLKNEIIMQSGGHLQYIYLVLFALQDNPNTIKSELFEILLKNENINLLSEEIYNRLNNFERKLLLKILNNDNITKIEKHRGQYLWNTGIFNKNNELFSSLFESFIKSLKDNQTTFKNSILTKKEFLMFEVLKDNQNKICNRELLAKYVWPEYIEYGVSDWTIDRLMARLRKKLKISMSKYKIQTIKTRGFQLIKI